MLEGLYSKSMPERRFYAWRESLRMQGKSLPWSIKEDIKLTQSSLNSLDMSPLGMTKFIGDEGVKLVGAEAGGQGMEEGVLNSATLTRGSPGVLHGARTYVMQDEYGQTAKTSSISAGLDYPGVGPEHAFLKDSGRAEYVAVTDKEALEGFQQLCKLEGIIPALETSHAVFAALEIAKTLPKDQDIVINLSGRGDKDMPTVAKVMGVQVD